MSGRMAEIFLYRQIRYGHDPMLQRNIGPMETCQRLLDFFDVNDHFQR